MEPPPFAMAGTRYKQFPSSETPKPHFTSTPTSIIRGMPTSVDLSDWWLIKVDGKGLGIEGFASRLNLGVRIFTSQAISIRHCTNILETSDKITVRISGLLNISRTCQNGFPSEVCSKFMHGFPHNWEHYAATDSVTWHEPNTISGNLGNDLSPFWNDLRPTTINDLLLSTLGHSSYDLIVGNICSDVPIISNKSVIPKKAKYGRSEHVSTTQPRITRSMSGRKSAEQ